MKINKITMSGFRGATTPVEVNFDTSKSVALIFGENGTGKSTIADAFDFLCNASYGSLDNYSLGEPPRKFVPSLGKKPSTLKVTLSSGSSTWVATLGTDGPTVNPRGGYPDANILRRKAILRLIEAQPKKRFEELKTFIAVPNIEKSEEALREAVRTTEERFNESIRALSQAKDGLDQLWVREGKPSSDAIAWAKGEAAKKSPQLQTNVEEITKIERAFSASDTATTALNKARQEQTTLELALADAEKKQKDAETGQTQQNAELLSLLQDARTYIQARQTLSECPVCERAIDTAALVQRIATRINDMQDLKILVEATTRARTALEAKVSVVSQAQRDFCAKAKELGVLLKSSGLDEILSLKLTWDNYKDLLSNAVASDSIEQQARDLLSATDTSRAWLRRRRDADQKSINLQNAVKGYIDTLESKGLEATTHQGLLKKLKSALDIASKERKDYVEGILVSIAGEVERLYTAVHPGEGIGKIRFYLKPNTIGSLEFDGQFQNIPDLPPQAYYSESHLDTLGICVFLALTKCFKTDNTIVVLDDVLTSVDGPHLERFMKLLHDEATSFSQFIITTHYRPWRERYRWAKGPTANTQLIELGPWTLQTGVRIGQFLSAITELRGILQENQLDRQGVASKAGIILESLLDFLTLKYRCRMPRNPRNAYTFGELAQGIDSRLSQELRARKASTKGGAKADTMLKALVDSATDQNWVRNAVGAHFSSLGTEITDGEVRKFGQDVLGLSDMMICEHCESLPTRRPSGSYWQCQCAELELYPLIYPGADPSTVDDEA